MKSKPSVASPAASATDGTASVLTNRGSDVQVGFRGDVHPAMANQSLTVKAVCSPIGKGRGFSEGYFPQQFRGPFDVFAVKTPLRNYSAHDLSGFLPQTFEQPGQIWDIDLNRIAPFMKQFHSGASMRLGAPGRRSGPNGAFGVLLGVSDTQYDILARVHAEFVLAPGIYLTPAYFEGRMLINRKKRQVEAFSLSVPTNTSLNATLTAVLPSEALIDIVHLDYMELTGGRPAVWKEDGLSQQITLTEARRKLKGTFFKFADINWVKPERALEEARKQNRPILAIVLWGDLDDQSC
jgi:hypothetical protein